MIASAGHHLLIYSRLRLSSPPLQPKRWSVRWKIPVRTLFASLPHIVSAWCPEGVRRRRGGCGEERKNTFLAATAQGCLPLPAAATPGAMEHTFTTFFPALPAPRDPLPLFTVHRVVKTSVAPGHKMQRRTLESHDQLRFHHRGDVTTAARTRCPDPQTVLEASRLAATT